MKYLFQRLEKRLKERRIYQIKPGGFYFTLDQPYNYLQDKNYDPNRKNSEFNPHSETVVFSDMCVRKPGTPEALGQKWGLNLPEDYLEFCSLYSEYVLAGRCAIHLESAEWLEKLCNVRDGWDVPKETPHRLFYFARVVDECGYFVFRWSENYQKMDVVFAEDYGDIGEPGLLADDGDKYVTDPDFTTWLTRMLDTDCYPLVPGRREPMRAGLKRIK
jgi:hypothetical protein